MTAEIGILNTKGIALAADSAVTINGKRTFNNATKLFTLDSSHYVGIMIFGNADIMTIPWEIIIKRFRETIGNNSLDSLFEYANNFIHFVSKLPLWNGTNKYEMVKDYAYDLMGVINRKFSVKINSITKRNPNININVENVIVNVINDININENNENQDIFKIDKESFIKESSDIVKEIIQANLNIKVNDKIMSTFLDKLYNMIINKSYPSMNSTGIVFGGYGKKDIFPKLIQLEIDGIYKGKIKYRVIKKTSIGINEDELVSELIPFAQDDMVYTITRGIDPQLNNILRQQLEKLQNDLIKTLNLNNDAQENINNIFLNNKNTFEHYMYNFITGPIVNMLSNLSLNELGNMAETFVSLTSFKRKFSGDLQTVGGPVDVLVISRGEGPIWIKRKKYFNLEMNSGYQLRRK